MVDRKGILLNSPLIFSLASVRFASWPLISKRVDEIHNDLRRFVPLLQHIQVQQVGTASQPQPEVASIWMMLSADRSRGVQLSQDQILCFSKNYTEYTDFATLIKRVIEAMLTRMEFMDVSSLGTRYVDHIKAREDEELGQYIAPSLLAPVFDGLQRVGGLTQGFYRSDDSELRVRCTSQPGLVAVPEDVIPTLAMMEVPGRQLELKPLEGGQALLDMDAVKQYPVLKRMEAAEELLQKLDDLHKVANTFFRREDVCTDHAFTVWRGKRS